MTRGVVLRNYALLAAGGVAGGAAVYIPWLWPLALVALVPLYAYAFDTNRTPAAAGFGGWLFGASLVGTSILCTFHVYPLDWAGVEFPPLAWLLIFTVWSATAAVLGIPAALYVLVVRFVTSRTAAGMLAAPFVWPLCEAARAWLFTYLMWGTGSVPDAYFTFGTLGLALTESDTLLALAQYGGVYVFSLFAALAALCIWLAVARTEYRTRLVALTGTMLAIGLIACILRPVHVSPAPLRIATLHTSFPAHLSLSGAELVLRAQEVEQQLHALAQEEPDIVVLPEGTRFLSTLESADRHPQSVLQDIFGQREVLVIDTRFVPTIDGEREELVFFSSVRGEIASRAKRVLVPFGEYVPYWVDLMMRATGFAPELEALRHHRSYTPATRSDVEPVRFKGVALVGLMCSEALVPHAYGAALGVDGPVVLVIVSSQAIFHGGKNPLHQLRAMAKAQSVWAGVPFYLAVNEAPRVRPE